MKPLLHNLDPNDPMQQWSWIILVLLLEVVLIHIIFSQFGVVQ